MRHLPRQQTKLRDAEGAEMRDNRRQTDGETTAAPERTINTPITQMTETGTSLRVEIVAIESRNNEERRANSETQLKIAVNKEVDHRKGTLTVTLETIAEFVAITVPVRIIIGAPVGQITTGGLF